jgi:hypothetical protein
VRALVTATTLGAKRHQGQQAFSHSAAVAFPGRSGRWLAAGYGMHCRRPFNAGRPQEPDVDRQSAVVAAAAAAGTAAGRVAQWPIRHETHQFVQATNLLAAVATAELACAATGVTHGRMRIDDRNSRRCLGRRGGGACWLRGLASGRTGPEYGCHECDPGSGHECTLGLVPRGGNHQTARPVLTANSTNLVIGIRQGSQSMESSIARCFTGRGWQNRQELPELTRLPIEPIRLTAC